MYGTILIMKIRCTTISYAIYNVKVKRQQEKELTNDMQMLETYLTDEKNKLRYVTISKDLSK